MTADPALLLGETDPLASEGTGSFGVALRPWAGQEGLAAHVADACASVLSGRRALLLPMQPQGDKPVAEQFARQWHQADQARNRATLCSLEKGLTPLLRNIATLRPDDRDETARLDSRRRRRCPVRSALV